MMMMTMKTMTWLLAKPIHYPWWLPVCLSVNWLSHSTANIFFTRSFVHFLPFSDVHSVGASIMAHFNQGKRWCNLSTNIASIVMVFFQATAPTATLVHVDIFTSDMYWWKIFHLPEVFFSSRLVLLTSRCIAYKSSILHKINFFSYTWLHLKVLKCW